MKSCYNHYFAACVADVTDLLHLHVFFLVEGSHGKRFSTFMRTSTFLLSKNKLIRMNRYCVAADSHTDAFTLFGACVAYATLYVHVFVLLHPIDLTSTRYCRLDSYKDHSRNICCRLIVFLQYSVTVKLVRCVISTIMYILYNQLSRDKRT